MGRTNPTFRDLLDNFETTWQPYCRALRGQHQDDFEQLLEDARQFADAAGIQNPVNPQDAILISMILALAVRQRELEARLEQLTADDA